MHRARPDNEVAIRARINPLVVTVFMAFPLIWLVGTAIAYFQTGDPWVAIFGLLVFDAPVAAVIYNFFWHYRLELVGERLSIHRFFRWGGKGVFVRDLREVALRPGKLGEPQIVFQWPGDEIRLMWRGSRGNWWPPVILARMLTQLSALGVSVAPEVWTYLKNEQRTGGRSTTALVTVLSILLALTLGVLVAGTVIAASTRDFTFALKLTGVTLPFMAAIYAGIGGVLWLIDLHYGDLGQSTGGNSPIDA